jgi:hypothetical protein
MNGWTLRNHSHFPFLEVPHKAKSIVEKNPSLRREVKQKLRQMGPTKETITSSPPRCAMQGALIDPRILELGKSQQGKYEEGKEEVVVGEGRGDFILPWTPARRMICPRQVIAVLPGREDAP